MYNCRSAIDPKKLEKPKKRNKKTEKKEEH